MIDKKFQIYKLFTGIGYGFGIQRIKNSIDMSSNVNHLSHSRIVKKYLILRLYQRV